MHTNFYGRECSGKQSPFSTGLNSHHVPHKENPRNPRNPTQTISTRTPHRLFKASLGSLCGVRGDDYIVTTYPTRTISPRTPCVGYVVTLNSHHVPQTCTPHRSDSQFLYKMCIYQFDPLASCHQFISFKSKMNQTSRADHDILTVLLTFGTRI